MAATKKNAQTEAATTEEVNPVLANENMEQVMEEHKTKSSAIRYFASKGYERKHIAKAMNIRYQHVRNVLVQDAAKKQD